MFLSTYSTSSSSYKSKKFVGALHTELVLAHRPVELLGVGGSTPHHVASPVDLASSRLQGGINPSVASSLTCWAPAILAATKFCLSP